MQIDLSLSAGGGYSGCAGRTSCYSPHDSPSKTPRSLIDNLLVRIHFIIVIVRWTGLAP